MRAFWPGIGLEKVHLREEELKSAQKQVEEAKAELLKGVSQWLKTSDLKLIAEKATKKLKERGEGFFPTQEDIKNAMDEELAALFQEKMKGNWRCRANKLSSTELALL